MKIIDIVWLEMPGAKVFQLTVPHLRQIQRALRGQIQLRHILAESVLEIPEEMTGKVLVARGASAQAFVRENGFSDAVCPSTYADTITLVAVAVLTK